MLSKLIVSFVFTLLVLQQSVAALPTRGPIGQLQRRASKVARGPRPTEPPFLKKRGPSQKFKRAVAAPTQNIAYEKRAASIANYVAALGRRAAEDASIVAAMSTITITEEAAPSFAPTTAPAAVKNPKSGLRKAALQAEFSASSSGAGTPTATSTWVSANVTLPSAVKRTAKPSLALNRRMVPHPGAPTGTIKINVIGGDQMSSFTLINATSTSEKLAPTTEHVKVGDSNITLPAKELPTVTQTITFTAPSDTTQTATVTLVPTLLPSAAASAYVAEGNDAASDCTVPISAASNGTVTVECGDSKVEVSVNVNTSVSVEIDSKQEVKRNIAYFEAPVSYSKETMLSEDWEDCIIGVDADCIAIPDY